MKLNKITVHFMIYVRPLRHQGVRLPAETVHAGLSHAGDFVLDISQGSRRLRIKDLWSGKIAPIELYEPQLVAATPGMQRWRGFERVGDVGYVQEWLVRTSDDPYHPQR